MQDIFFCEQGKTNSCQFSEFLIRFLNISKIESYRSDIDFSYELYSVLNALFKSIVRILLIQKTRLKFSWNWQELTEKNLKNRNFSQFRNTCFVFHEFRLQFRIEREKTGYGKYKRSASSCILHQEKMPSLILYPRNWCIPMRKSMIVYLKFRTPTLIYWITNYSHRSSFWRAFIWYKIH